jgi:hypothetical protein
VNADQKKPSAGFWITFALVAVIVAYPLSFGPACWWKIYTFRTEPMHSWSQDPVAPTCYWPIGWVARHGPKVIHRQIFWYATIVCKDSGTPKGVFLPTGWKNNDRVHGSTSAVWWWY